MLAIYVNSWEALNTLIGYYTGLRMVSLCRKAMTYTTWASIGSTVPGLEAL